MEYCHRPFTNTDKMRHAIIGNYIKTVTDEDTVYFLGDMTLVGPANKQYLLNITSRLPGTKHLILGNHDKLDPFDYEDGGFQTVHTALDIGEFVLVHDPARCIVDSTRKWLCGHVHTLFRKNRNGNVLNIGVDQWGFFPVVINEVRRYFEEPVVVNTAGKHYEDL
uniref:Calcineurin-like phosphoesterase domain-containing protein n=2 Tax=viral metagenome TaxID=1070528 RepID=A0A6M3IVM8_9ZZZZ